MAIKGWYYLFVAALVNVLFQYFWIKYFKKKSPKDKKMIAIIFLSSFGVTWGMDVIQKGLEIFLYYHMLQISLGCWVMFALASGGKLYFFREIPKRDVVIDFGGELLSYFLMGTIVYVLS